LVLPVIATWIVTAASLVAAVRGEVAADTPGAWDLEVVAVKLPSPLLTGSETTTRLVLRNRGSVAWSPESNFRVAYHWLTPDGRVVVRDGLRTDLVGKVPAGEEVSLDARLLTPTAPGDYLLQWDVVCEGLVWVSERDPTPPVPVAVHIDRGPLTHAFTTVSSAMPAFAVSGERRTVSMLLRNDGTEPWTPERPINVSYHWTRSDGTVVLFEGARTRIPSEVRPGGEVWVAAALEIPDRVGRYRLQWDMVEDGVCWFADRDPTPERAIAVIVLPELSLARHGATAVALGCLALVIVARRREPGTPLRRVARLSDIVWIVLALAMKQGTVLGEMGSPPGEGSGWLILGGAAGIGLVLLFLHEKARPWLAWLVGAFVSVVLLADVVYARFFGDVISLISIGAARQAGDVGASIASLLRGRDAWVLADLLPGALVAMLIGKLREPADRAGRKYAAALLMLLTVAGASALVLKRPGEATSFEQVFKSELVVRRIGPVNFHCWDAAGYLRARLFREPLTASRQNTIVDWFETHREQRAGAGPWFGAASGKNLLMIQVESMQGFVLGYKVDGQEVTPNLDRWKARSAWFSAVTDQTSQGRTSDAELATQVSLLPPLRGAAAFRYGDHRFHGIAGILGGRGYATLSAVPFDGNFWNRRVTHPAYGFNTSLFEEAFEPGPVVGWGLNDRDFLRQMLPKLAATRKPFCALLITLSNHHPFSEFPRELEELRLGSLEGTRFGNYLHTMHLFDKAFGELMAGLEERGMLDDTVVVLWGDHAAGFPWDATFARATGIRMTEPGYYIADRVPLMIHVPGAPELNGEKTLRAGQIDVAPTLLALMGVDPAPYAFLGRNLLGNPGDVPVTQQYGAWMTAQHLYVASGPGLTDGGCFDVASMEALPVDACGAGRLAARELIDVSRGVLRWDLQVDVHTELSGRRDGN
jgi:phosphoglycerol transferase MdoB-like AlkP superfamily enzyme